MVRRRTDAPLPARSRRRGQSGLSLLEVMISLSILAVGLLAMLAMQASAMKQGRYGRHTTLAAQIARDEMELLKRVPWNDARIQAMGWTALPAVPIEVETASGTIQEQVFNVSKRVSQDPVYPDLRQVDVRVTWVEPTMPPNAPPRRYAMSSMRHNDP